MPSTVESSYIQCSRCKDFQDGSIFCFVWSIYRQKGFDLICTEARCHPRGMSVSLPSRLEAVRRKSTPSSPSAPDPCRSSIYLLGPLGSGRRCSRLEDDPLCERRRHRMSQPCRSVRHSFERRSPALRAQGRDMSEIKRLVWNDGGPEGGQSALWHSYTTSPLTPIYPMS